ncbi:uncharacterized protein [Gossypium hirsutum]|uniref:Integrase zinc-binding domain-containing protein n=1 Tax=Gossypium hirsutum TaxID=3635 RepID=A0A1U8MZQ9_GOSHI|nr:uncharacterized protein LOC107941951 [Gossypium hirsutum]
MVANALSRRAKIDLRAMLARLSLLDDGSLLAERQVKLVWIQRMCIPKDDDLRQSALQEAHSGLYAMHPGGNKMYRNLRELYWWPGLKCEVMESVGKCLVCQKVKVEH